MLGLPSSILMAVFQVQLGQPVPPWFPSSTCSRRQHLGISGTGFFQAGCPSIPTQLNKPHKMTSI